MLGTFLDFIYFGNYSQTKETAWKRDDAIFSEPDLIWSFLGEFWTILIKIKQNITKIWCFKQILLISSSCSQKLQFHKRKLRL